MKQWDVCQYAFEHGAHPCVVISPPDLAENPEIQAVNILQCSTHRANRPPYENEVMLDKEDGLDWETLARCDRIHLVLRSDLKSVRGCVIPERRREIGRKIIQIFRLLV